MQIIAMRKIDDLGRIVIPIELRKQLQMGTNTKLDICIGDGGQIVLRKSEPYCKICGKTKNLVQMANKNIFICTACKASINELHPE